MCVWRALAAPADSSSPLWPVSVQDPRLSTGCGGPEAAKQCALLPRCSLVPRMEKKLGNGPKTESSYPALLPDLSKVLSG